MAIAAAVGEMALITCASLRSPWLGGAATFDRTAGDDVKPRWFLVFVHDLLRSAPPRMIGIPSTTVISTVLFLFALFVALFPLVDRKASRVGQVAGLVVMAAIAGGTFRALLP
jgi:quinol-cytochrome oxidoreductase complex cytochrome b subunit